MIKAIQSIPEVSPLLNTPVHSQLPMRAPTMPRTTVMRVEMSCLPGSASRARAPMIAPRITVTMMVVSMCGTPLRVQDPDPTLDARLEPHARNPMGCPQGLYPPQSPSILEGHGQILWLGSPVDPSPPPGRRC